MIGHAFGSGYHTTLVKLFGGHSSTMEASLQLNILEASVFIQQIISEWPASGGGQLHDPIQYQQCVLRHLAQLGMGSAAAVNRQ